MKKNEIQRTTNGFMAIKDFDITSVINDDLAGLGITFEKVKFPTGGGIVFEVPSDDPENPDIVKELTGVILYQHHVKRYYNTKFTGGNNIPDCYSIDGNIGIGNPGGDCSKCVFNTFGTALNGLGGKACKDRRDLYILREGERLPMLLSLPTGSLNNLKLYISKIYSKKGLRYNQVITKLSLKKASNTDGAEYSQAVFKVERELLPEEFKAISALSEQIKAVASSIIVSEEDEDYVQDPNID